MSVVYCKTILDASVNNHFTQVKFDLLIEKALSGWNVPGTYDVIDPNSKVIGSMVFDEAYDTAVPETYLKKQGGTLLNVKPLRALATPTTTLVRSTAQAFTTGVVDSISWSGLISGNLERLWDSTLPTRITFNIAAQWLITISIEWAATNTTGGRALQVRQDGNNALMLTDESVVDAAGNAVTGQNLSFVVTPTVPGTYIEFRCSQSSGVTLNLTKARLNLVRL